MSQLALIRRHGHIELSVISVAMERDAVPPNDTAQGQHAQMKK